jgi:hypothetical protein
MKRETFVTIMSSLLAEANHELLREAEGLVFWRKRELRAEEVQEYEPGQTIEYLAKDGRTRKQGTIAKLNKYSVTVRHPHATEGYKPEVIMIERVLGLTPIHYVEFTRPNAPRDTVISEGLGLDY